MSLWERFVAFPFYQHALAAGVGIAVACALLSVFVVNRKMAFVGHGISHAAFGGVGAALLAELAVPQLASPLARWAVIAGFCVLAALAIGRMGQGRSIGHDSAIGIVLSLAMAVGVLLIDVRSEVLQKLAARGMNVDAIRTAAPSFHDLLFGNILSVSTAETWVAVALGLLVAALVALVFRALVFWAVDEEAAAAFGVPTSTIHYGLLVALGLTIAAAMRLVGVILAGALLILPGTIAGLWSRRIRVVLVLAPLLSASAVVVGLVVSMIAGVLSTGPLIVLVLSVLFFLTWFLRGRRG